MANLPMGGCVTQVSIMREVKNLLGLYLNPKDLKSGKKWPSYGRVMAGLPTGSWVTPVRIMGD